MEIHEKIKALREDHDKTQAEIAKILGTSFQYYQKYEKGKHPIPIQHLKTLCEYYHVSANYLLEIPETHDRTKAEILERTKQLKDRISKETAIEIILYAEEQRFIKGDTDWIINTIEEYKD